MTVDDQMAHPRCGELLGRVPGRANRQRQALQEFRDDLSKERARLSSALHRLLPRAEQMYRWKVQLGCGCVNETLTNDKDAFPDARTYRDPVTRGLLPLGQAWCFNDHGLEQPYREIVSWVDRRLQTFDADPDEPQHGLDPETWHVIRRPTPHTSAFWRVGLSCGHLYDSVVAKPDWNPDGLPHLVSAQRLAEMRGEFDDHRAQESATRTESARSTEEHIRRMLDRGWPSPVLDVRCFACSRTRPFAAYRRIGWLVPRRSPLTGSQTRRSQDEARLAAAEAEVQRLRRKLGVVSDSC